MLSEYDKQIEKLALEWDRTEKILKQVEQIGNQGPLYPAIGELRYAGRRLVDAINHTQGRPAKLPIETLLQDAYLNLIKAQHDAVDAAQQYFRDRRDHVLETVDIPIIKDYMPSFWEFHQSLSLFEQRISQSRGEQHERDSIYDEVAETALDDLVELYGKIRADEDLMLLYMEQQESVWEAEKRRANEAENRAKILYVVTFVSLLLATSVALFKFVG